MGDPSEKNASKLGQGLSNCSSTESIGCSEEGIRTMLTEIYDTKFEESYDRGETFATDSNVEKNHYFKDFERYWNVS